MKTEGSHRFGPGIYHELRLFKTNFSIESKGDPFVSRDGKIFALPGSGMGVNIDPDYVKSFSVFSG